MFRKDSGANSIAGIKLKGDSGKNLVAKGGTSEKNIETTHQLGFHGIAFNSYIWKATDPLGNFIKIIKKMKELGIEIN